MKAPQTSPSNQPLKLAPHEEPSNYTLKNFDYPFFVEDISNIS